MPSFAIFPAAATPRISLSVFSARSTARMTSITPRIADARTVPSCSIRATSATTFAAREPAISVETTADVPPVSTDRARPASSSSAISARMTPISESSSCALSAKSSSAFAPSRSESAISVACFWADLARLWRALAALPSHSTSASDFRAASAASSRPLASARHFLASSRIPSGSAAGSVIPKNSRPSATVSPNMWLNLLM
ncbi:hypothetical protein STENM36S_09587 [Streptomyces tendae]